MTDVGGAPPVEAPEVLLVWVLVGFVMGEFQLAGMRSLPCRERRLKGKNGHVVPYLAGERGSQFTLR
jgi:hypothetical protein